MAPVERLRLQKCALVIAASFVWAMTGCSDPAAPVESNRGRFTGQRYNLVELDGQSLPAPYEWEGYTYLVGTATLDFVSDDTLRWTLDDLTAVSPGAPPLGTILGSDGYRVVNPDSIEVGAPDFGVFSVSPWAYGGRVSDTLHLRTVDPVPSDPRVPDLAPPILGLHVWLFRRQK